MLKMDASRITVGEDVEVGEEHGVPMTDVPGFWGKEFAKTRTIEKSKNIEKWCI